MADCSLDNVGPLAVDDVTAAAAAANAELTVDTSASVLAASDGVATIQTSIVVTNSTTLLPVNLPTTLEVPLRVDVCVRVHVCTCAVCVRYCCDVWWGRGVSFVYSRALACNKRLQEVAVAWCASDADYLTVQVKLDGAAGWVNAAFLSDSYSSVFQYNATTGVVVLTDLSDAKHTLSVRGKCAVVVNGTSTYVVDNSPWTEVVYVDKQPPVR